MNGVVVAETMRRHFISVFYWTVVALAVITGLGTAKFNTPGGLWPMVIALLAIVTGAAPIGPEFSSGTLQLILVKPVTRSAYLLSRVVGVVFVVWLAAAAGAGAEIIGRALLTESVPVARVGAVLLNTCVEVVMTVALLVFFASFTRAYLNVAIYFVLQIGVSVAAGLLALSRKFPEVVQVLERVSANLFPDAPRAVDPHWLLVVFSNAAVALVLACLLFRRREVPYGAD